jgi:hypothetical protein
MSDQFRSSIPDDALPALLGIGRELGFDPLASTEMEEYWAKFLSGLSAGSDLAKEARAKALREFRSLGGPPNWEQGAEWPIDAGEPMVFVGAISVPRRLALFHDDSTFFVFYSPSTGHTQTVIQTA